MSLGEFNGGFTYLPDRQDVRHGSKDEQIEILAVLLERFESLPSKRMGVTLCHNREIRLGHSHTHRFTEQFEGAPLREPTYLHP
jgi:hypothetical protein